MTDGIDIHPGAKRRREKRRSGKRERERRGGINSRYFSSLFKVLWKTDKLLAQLNPRQPKETDPRFKERRTVLLWKTKTH